eukprot:TRINITY_DN7038_c0_g1_i1.p1 TRINITY_DN7038_c0_g1~~TRINITY_DN7038_c0_g1_i1.p1  ORF type:complete len:349 (+),score=58.05 TRINITY_DN7038_c0_g1_i1:62-1048(+)
MCEITCGFEVNGVRVWSQYEEFFRKDVLVFSAADDPLGRKLYRSADLAAMVDCDGSRIGMFLKRRKGLVEGIYQANSFRHKPDNVLGLRTGGYFLTLDCCKSLIEELRRSMQLHRHRKELGLLSNKTKKGGGDERRLSEKSVGSGSSVSSGTLPLATPVDDDDSKPSQQSFRGSPRSCSTESPAGSSNAKAPHETYMSPAPPPPRQLAANNPSPAAAASFLQDSSSFMGSGPMSMWQPPPSLSQQDLPVILQPCEVVLAQAINQQQPAARPGSAAQTYLIAASQAPMITTLPTTTAMIPVQAIVFTTNSPTPAPSAATSSPSVQQQRR